MSLQNVLIKLGACTEAIEWAKDYPDVESAWVACQRADWMAWLLRLTDVEQDKLRLMACDIAETVLPLVSDGDDRMRAAIEAARRYADGQITQDRLERTRGYASITAYASSAAYAAYATTTPLLCSSVVAAHVCALSKTIHVRQSDIVRRHFPSFPGFSDKALITMPEVK